MIRDYFVLVSRKSTVVNLLIGIIVATLLAFEKSGYSLMIFIMVYHILELIFFNIYCIGGVIERKYHLGEYLRSSNKITEVVKKAVKADTLTMGLIMLIDITVVVYRLSISGEQISQILFVTGNALLLPIMLFVSICLERYFSSDLKINFIIGILIFIIGMGLCFISEIQVENICFSIIYVIAVTILLIIEIEVLYRVSLSCFNKTYFDNICDLNGEEND